MKCGHLATAIQRAKRRGVFLICLALILGGCRAQEPPLSPEARALKKELLGKIQTLTTQLIEPVSNQDWDAVKPILQTAYENMEKEAKLLPLMIAVLDRNGITRARVPSEVERHFDFSRYKPARVAFEKKRKTQALLYLGEQKIFLLLVPLLQNNKVLGAVTLSYSKNELQKQWNVSQEEFLSLDFNR